jgi:hypothetical protein
MPIDRYKKEEAHKWASSFFISIYETRLTISLNHHLYNLVLITLYYLQHITTGG